MPDPTHPWTDRLSEYLDGELSETECAALERHLAACPTCTATLAELTRVVMRARALAGQQPARDLWDGIAAQIAARPVPGSRLARDRTGRRWSFSWPELAAAAVAIAVGSGGVTWWVARHAPAATPAAGVSVPASEPVPAAAGLTPRYDAAVADLERVLAAGRNTLDSGTVRVLEQNLALIDRAIGDAQRALAADPGNAYLNAHLARTMRQKLDLLRHAATLAAAQS
jgi:anti-sigma factor RsiW